MKSLLFVLLIVPSFLIAQPKAYTQKMLLMHCKSDITVVANSQQEADSYIEMAVKENERIEGLLSEWMESSQISEVNRQAGIRPVKVDDEVFRLIERCKKISEITDGAFDITFASIDKIWKFDGTMTKLPTKEEVQASVARIGYKKILLDEKERTVFLSEKGMKLGFGAIGQGYGADKARELLQAKGVKAGIINSSGDITSWGTQPDGNPWIIGISNPLNSNKVFSWFPIDKRAVTTSGGYEKYVVFDGVHYCHIIDPRTGYPARGLASVTVFAPKGELADALATGIFVMGREAGMNLVEQLKGVDCVMVDNEGKIYTSKGIQLNPVQP